MRLYIFEVIIYQTPGDSVSSEYPLTKKRVENMTCSRVFFMFG